MKGFINLLMDNILFKCILWQYFVYMSFDGLVQFQMIFWHAKYKNKIKSSIISNQKEDT
jgi:hypothetical protein